MPANKQAASRSYWLVKTEPDSYSIDDLANEPQRVTSWDGVRNYQARNFLRDQMRRGDQVLVYHSSADPPAVVGIATVVREGYPDPTALDRRSKYYDPQSSAEQPRWYAVDLKLKKKFRRSISLSELREHPQLKGLELLRRGSRLSVQPVSAEHFEFIVNLTM